MKRILIFVLIIFSLTGCGKKQTDEESEVVGERIRIKELSDEHGNIAKFIYDSNGLLTFVKGGASMAEIKYNSSNLPISVSYLDNSDKNCTIEWSDNNTKFTIKGGGRDIKYPEIITIDSKNQIAKINGWDDYMGMHPELSHLVWSGDSLNYIYDDEKWCAFTYKLSNKKHPFRNINIALLRLFELGVGHMGFDHQNLFCPTKYRDYDVLGHSRRTTYTYIFDNNDFPIQTKASSEFPDINETYTGVSYDYYEYEKY